MESFDTLFTNNGKIHYFSDPNTDGDFETAYIKLREKEGRIYTTAQLKKLPEVPKNHPHFKEWQMRKSSAMALIKHLGNQKNALKILDLGCGNGWMSQMLSEIPNSQVLGMDLNDTELKQAVGAFNEHTNLAFAYGDVFNAPFPQNAWDEIVVASCIQYFPDAKALIKHLLMLLKPSGTIHILDSPFYALSEIQAAKKRTAAYYQNAGFPEMTGHYYHHPFKILKAFNFEVKSPSGGFIGKVIRKMTGQTISPFPWVCIKKQM